MQDVDERKELLYEKTGFMHAKHLNGEICS